MRVREESWRVEREGKRERWMAIGGAWAGTPMALYKWA
jgi:hypothetical protein